MRGNRKETEGNLTEMEGKLKNFEGETDHITVKIFNHHSGLSQIQNMLTYIIRWKVFLLIKQIYMRKRWP